MHYPLDVFEDFARDAKVYERAILKTKSDKLAEAKAAGERERERLRLERIGLPPLFIEA